MTSMRPIEHSVFPGFLQNHSVMRPGLNLKESSSFDRYLRYAALFHRGIAVVDSDLNNNEVFHDAAHRPDGLFWNAVRTGFIRRTARIDYRGNLLSQREVAESLRGSSPERFSLIPEEYPGMLDAALSASEKENPSLTWTLPKVNKVFGGKLLGMLKGAKSDPSRDSTQLGLFDKIASWIIEQLGAGVFFGAADIETQLRPPAGTAGRVAWDKAVWPLVLDAHIGNIPLTFGGALPVKAFPEANDRLLPAGPESSAEERMIAALLYAGTAGQHGIEFEVRRVDHGLQAWNINMDRLSELSLEQVEELREASMPDEFLDRRFHANGSGANMMAGAAALREAFGAFIERLASAGIALTTDAQWGAVRSELWAARPRRDGNADRGSGAFTRTRRRIRASVQHSVPGPRPADAAV